MRGILNHISRATAKIETSVWKSQMSLRENHGWKWKKIEEVVTINRRKSRQTQTGNRVRRPVTEGYTIWYLFHCCISDQTSLTPPVRSKTNWFIWLTIRLIHWSYLKLIHLIDLLISSADSDTTNAYKLEEMDGKVKPLDGTHEIWIQRDQDHAWLFVRPGLRK